MASKGRRKKDTKSEVNIHKEENLLNYLDVKLLSTTKFIEVIFIFGENEHSNGLLEMLKPMWNQYEEVAYATIITFENSLEILENFEPVGMPENFETSFKSILINLKSVIDNGGVLTPLMIAQLLKIKLIHTIYRHNLANKERKLRIKALDEELNLLTKDCRNSDKSKNEKVRQSLSKIDVSETTTFKQRLSRVGLTDEHKKSKTKVDYETPNQTESIEDIIFDDDVSKHIWFYIFQGFEDSEIIRCVTKNLNIQVTAIIEMKLDYIDEHESARDKMKKFWLKMLDYLYSSHREESLENTILMKYNNTNNLDYEDIYQELIYMLKNIWKIKLTHLHYIRNTKMVQIRGTYKPVSAECLKTYGKLMQSLPNELVDEVVIFSSLLEEVVFQLTDRPSCLLGNLVLNLNWSKSVEKNDYCSNPLIITNIIRNSKDFNRKATPEFTNNAHVIYDSNLLALIMRSFNGNIGNLLSELSLNVWKRTLPFSLVNKFCISDDLIHKHDSDPSSSLSTVDTEKMLHFMYIFLFGFFRQPDTILNNSETEFTENLDVYSKFSLWQRSQVSKTTTTNIEINPSKNLYRPSLVSYVWKENLSSDVLIQKVANAEEEYQYIQVKYCPETEHYLLLCSDYLDEFGINVKIVDELLPTPVCLRDFCKYVTPDKSDWLSQNRPPKYYRKDEQIECYGEKKISNLENDEYKHLLSSRLNIEGDSISDSPEKEVKNITFEDLLKELKHYPLNKNLGKETAKISNVHNINVFDIGTYIISVVGAITTFVSHDAVKLTVDNTKFIYEEPKCKVRLTCRNNDIVLYSDPFFLENNYDFHVNLKDGTIITFFMNDISETKVNISDYKASQATEKTTIIESISNIKRVMMNLKKTTIRPINKHDLDQKLKFIHTTDGINLDIGTFFKHLNDLKNTEFYKLDNSLKLILASKPQVEIPLMNFIDRLIQVKDKNTADNQHLYSKRHISSSFKKPKFTEPVFDFRISLPNGLYLSCIRSIDTNEPCNEIKQEFLRVNEADKIFEEEFRLFSKNGFVLVKKIDGTITIFKTSGDQIFFEKPGSAEESIVRLNFPHCHCKNMDDYKKKVVYIMNKRYGEDIYSSSRRGNIRTKKGYIIDEVILDMLKNSKIPYRKTTILKYTGHRTCLEGNKISQKHEYFQTCEHDYSAEEIYFERSDGFRSIFDKLGRHSVEFTDGTVITTLAHVKNELVDGFVYISLITRYEHPKYVTIGYDFDDSLTVELNNDVKLKKNHQDFYKMNIDSDIEINLDMKGVHFRKKCKNCQRRYKCDFNIEPLISKKIQLNDRFVSIRDSYEKKFFVDFAGNCQRSDTFVNRLTNNCNCNHVDGNIYTKLFIFNKNFTGEQLLSENLVEFEKNKIENKGRFKESLTLRGKKLLRFTKNNFQAFQSRFRNNSLKEKLILSKYKQKTNRKVEYQTYQVLQKIIDAKEIEINLDNLEHFLIANTSLWFNLKFVVKTMLADCEKLRLIKSVLPKTKAPSERKFERKCKCVVTKRTMQDKMFIWREELKKYKELIRLRNIPSYFYSEFCE